MGEERGRRADDHDGLAAIGRASDLAWVCAALGASREAILARWLEAAAAQPFHRGRRDGAVADHIPPLLDGIVAALCRAAPVHAAPGALLDDDTVRVAAAAHATARAGQGLRPAEILVEFRLLRREVGRALRRAVPPDAPIRDVIGGELLVQDALDGAAALALDALTGRFEREREEFLALIVHDTRQPLTRAAAAAQIAARHLTRDAPDLARVRGLLAEIEVAARQTAAQLADLAATSHVALAGPLLRPAPTDLATIVRAAIARLGPGEAARVRVVVAPGADLSGAWDRERLERVAANLLGNALKYSPADQAVDVALGGGERATLAVRDRGIGIPAADLGRIFEREHRADNVIASGIEGLGLGLYLCRGIVEAHGGRIWAESPGAGGGTTVHVDLPRAIPGDADRDTDGS